ncbi:DUF221-domain-containing protein [Exidia glandulosa HHB12029]|uniref:DUF221-domain-containing protein n=1 Tax=Exidia glandulosa HHB12029 TaxID=1314781 RepID=A0A165I1Y7_EXIGL|nr:DUF221-domain-containing protein [Exidia glandulosa HHB12029]
MSGVISDVITDSVDKLNKVAPLAVGTNCLLWTAVAFVTIIGFNILRPRVIYEPKVKYHVGEKKPPKISDGFFDWLSPLIHTKEPELLDKIGLDATTFLRFLRLMRWLFLSISILLCAMVLPVNITYSLQHIPAKQRDVLSILTIRDVGGNLLYIHVAATYVVTGMVFGFVWWHWKAMVRLRNQWFESDEYQKSFYARTLMIMDVPRKMQTDEGLQSLLLSLQMPYPTTAVHIGRKVGKLPELVEYHNDAVRELETYLVRYLKGGRIGKKRPTISKGGACGCGGEKKDAIDFYTAKLKKTEAAVEQWRNDIDLRQAESYGFASLASVPYAHIVARLMASKHPKGTTVTLAPNPKDIIWGNLNMSPAERASKRTVGFLWLSLVASLNTVPLLIISFFANLAALAAYVPLLNDWGQASPFTYNLASAVLPPTISAIFGYFLPIIMRKLSKYQGATTRTRLDRAVVARYFAFLVLSQLVIFSLIGVIFTSVTEIVKAVGKHLSVGDILKNLNKLPDSIHRTYIQQSNYWLTFFPLRGFLAVFDLAQVLKLVWTSIKTHVFGRTPRDIREWTKPPDFEYAIYYCNLLFMGTVGFTFAPLAPLVAVAAAVVFWVSSAVYKYQLMYIFVTKIESGGRLWNVVINRLLFSLLFMHLLMTLTIGLRIGFTSWTWIATIPPMLAVAGFKKYLTATFDNQFRYYIPSEEAIRKSQVHSANADNHGHRLEKRFGHPALYADLFTPMVHAKMVHLLPQVYSGNIGQSSANLDEYDGKHMEAQVLPGGIKIAGIEQHDLEYDPALYGRDRGEMEWDRRSSTHLLNNAAQFAQNKMHIPVNRIQGYLHHGVSPSLSGKGHLDNIELARMDSRSDAWPLLQGGGGVTPGGYSEAGTPGGELGVPYANSQYGASVSTHSLHQYPPMPYDRANTPIQQRPMTPQGHGQQPSQRSLTPGASVQPGQIFNAPQSVQPGQVFSQSQQQGVQPGQIFSPPRQQSVPLLQQPHPGQHQRAATYNAPQVSYDARPAPGDYFNNSPHGRTDAPMLSYASPVESPGGGRSPQPRGGTPQQGFTPRSQRQPSYDQLRQQQPPGSGGPHGRYPGSNGGY